MTEEQIFENEMMAEEVFRKEIMTDEQIIKALSTLSYGGHSCVKCKQKITNGDSRCGLKGCYIARLAIDLINRQKAEIKVYKEANILIAQQRDSRDKDITNLEAEIERLKWSKSTSLKEFAERLQAELTITGNNRSIVPIIIDNLLKEMESENK